ncbi:hypothetical protein KM043_015674 [Ampulex compressa]|nr:hypothetical protein KM043_015674 [Ampulex compressa]
MENPNNIQQRHNKYKEDPGKDSKEMTEKNGWSILNGNVQDDEDEEYIYLASRDYSIIDYVIMNAKPRGEIEKSTDKERMESDHMLLKVETEVIPEAKQREEEERWI